MSHCAYSRHSKTFRRRWKAVANLQNAAADTNNNNKPSERITKTAKESEISNECSTSVYAAFSLFRLSFASFFFVLPFRLRQELFVPLAIFPEMKIGSAPLFFPFFFFMGLMPESVQIAFHPRALNRSNQRKYKYFPIKFCVFIL